MYTNINELNKILKELEDKSIAELKKISDLNNLTKLETIYIGKNGYFFDILKNVDKFETQTQKEMKKRFFLIKQKINNLFKEKKFFLENEILNQRLQKEEIDVTIPSYKFPQGCSHPLNQTIQQIENFFLGLGYSLYEGTEIESDLYNFELLNIGKEHPSRDMQDSFYLNINPELLLRTHTSSFQIHNMLKNKNKSLKIISSGKVYRRDKDDDTHSHQFTQLDGFAIGPKVNLIELKQTIVSFIQHIFGEKQELRFRPSYFPFTKPSFEVDLVITNKDQKKVYLEILGAGLMHPQVLLNGGFDNSKYTGIAFGVGIERITMLKYNIQNIRHFYNNDIRFLNQFI
ncbi:phenylalanyl-tRNA synthetase subunit alpha [Candidatus Phytoplasma luffae]|uniref:Phenylalanine--tRNA ligase alpha subunit n=1 Tax=Loofah witches'-broom phytoplasma TaxID=35773 RepID=A0A975FJR4_LOWBP|nr:phenylalanine--tRNA ligase subunit alpha [Candidatus Phytoplasma luffae]QTX03254.1 phenylalanyl-tRNA synthetase subunit alpha [Candidatus Phytoplasma luffae]